MPVNSVLAYNSFVDVMELQLIRKKNVYSRAAFLTYPSLNVCGLWDGERRVNLLP